MEIEFDTFDQRAENYYYQITPTRGENPVEWADVLRTGQCLDKRWMAFWVGEETHGIIGSISCVSPIARPSSSSLAAELTHPVSSLVGNWIGIKVRIKGDIDNEHWRECWFSEEDGFQKCHTESPVGYDHWP